MRAITLLSVALLAAAVAAADVSPTAGADLAQRFGARPRVEHISLSPDGERIAWIQPVEGQGSVVYTMGFAPEEAGRAAFRIDGKPERLQRCNWVSSRRLVCEVFGAVQGAGGIYPFSRVIAADTDGSNVRVLSKRESADARGLNLYGGDVID